MTLRQNVAALKEILAAEEIAHTLLFLRRATAALFFMARARRRPVRFACPKLRAHGTPDAKRIRSLMCKSEKAHEHSRHEHAGHIRRSARNGFNGLLCMTPGVRCRHHLKSKTRAAAPGPCNLGRPRYGVVVSLGRIKKRRSLFRSAPDHPARASNTARGHRIPPRAS